MPLYLWIAVVSALGGVLRFALRFRGAPLWRDVPMADICGESYRLVCHRFFRHRHRPGRFLVNGTARQFFMTGVLGGFTTYSSFTLQTLTLARDGDWPRAAGNAFGTFVLCFVAVWLGHLAASAVNSFKAP